MRVRAPLLMGAKKEPYTTVLCTYCTYIRSSLLDVIINPRSASLLASHTDRLEINVSCFMHGTWNQRFTVSCNKRKKKTILTNSSFLFSRNKLGRTDIHTPRSFRSSCVTNWIYVDSIYVPYSCRLGNNIL
jgi:hypothetical protein